MVKVKEVWDRRVDLITDAISDERILDDNARTLIHERVIQLEFGEI